MTDIMWKPIVGTTYSVSTSGIIKRNEYISKTGNIIGEHIISQHIDRLGYYKVGLTINGICKTITVHKLVADAFIDKSTFKSMPDEDRSKIDLNKLEVNHKDEDKSNNCVSNLEWCTHKYNSNYGTRVARIIPKTIAKTRKRVIQYSLSGAMIKIWDGVNLAAKETGICQQNITKCYQHKRNSAGGYIWELYSMKEGDLNG